MKKIVTLWLVMMFGLTLISCGTNENTNITNDDTITLNDDTNTPTDDTNALTDGTDALTDDTNQLDELKLGEDYSTLITISLNPSFSMYIAGNIVVSLKCDNKDAENVLNGNNLEGMPIEDCVLSLLDILYQANYLNNDSNIVFDVQILDEVNNVQTIDMIKNGLETYKNQQSLSFTYDITREIVSNNDTINEDRFSVIERDENGNIVKTVEEKLNETNDGTIVETCFYNANGVLIEKIIETTDQIATIQYVNGVKSKEYRTCDDGSEYVNTFDEYGVLISSESINATGTHVITTFYTNGNIESKHEYGPNGDNKYYYDIDGNKTKYEGKDNYGYPVTGTYAKDGSAVFKTKLPDGSVIVSYYDANGNFIKEEKE